MRKHLAVALTAGMLAGVPALTASAGADVAPEFAPAPIRWEECRDERLRRAGAECGFLRVPLDYAEPNGRKISLAVSRIEHTSPERDYQGVMVVNPGGPGGSGRKLSLLGGAVPDGAGADYDWIGFDPRGVGASEPALSCDADYFSPPRPAYVPVREGVERTRLRRAADYAAACERAAPELLEHLRTTDTVQDLESLREALGRERINYYGFSYGTYIGQVYATKHPRHLRRLVMDGVVDPGEVWYRSNLKQDLAFDRVFEIYTDWIAEHDAVYHLGDTGGEVRQRYYGRLAELTREPAGGALGPAEWTDVFLRAGYGRHGWENIAEAFSALVHRDDPEPAMKLYEAAHGPGDNGYAMYLATECTDAEWPRRWNTWRADHWRAFAKAPFETWGNAWYNAPCRTWPVPAGERVRVDGGAVDGALLVNQEFDAATPYSGALEARERFPESALVGVPSGVTHSGSLAGNACVDDRIAAYLAEGALPERKPGRRADVTCEPLPAPQPDSGTAQREARSERQPAVLRAALRSARR
ncbi:peptidase [Actinopolyspora erythraea]|uniref:Peptidase n=2 Tax=Actinopolyspora erythraea TaxID=414996 RepID=A0ABR4X574_9ACTN|nr:alpha/beta hydrolase [Actinopolyspora erythraea]KGI81848.1 peptidase [Actinopolyspora erythraea]